MSGVDGLAVICEKHKVPVTDFVYDGVQVLHFPFQQNHSWTVLAVLAGMVQQHVEKITELGRYAGVMYIKEDHGQCLCTRFRAMVRVQFIKQRHYFFAQTERSRIAGRWRTF